MTRGLGIIILLAFNVSSILGNPVVNIKNGAVEGSIEQSRSGREYHSFRGIPFAKPPVGPLRFKDPQPAEPWSTVYNATQEGPACIQRNYYIAANGVDGEEDCLFINVYVPKRDGSKVEGLPVLVYMHWGGFFSGRGTSAYQSPEYLMDKDVIVVSFNYRLGIFGFISTYDDVAPGNYGLKDQRLALKWIQENIGSFGGDKNKVTISGESSGGISVHYHILSPLSKGLFHQAISESGTALSAWAVPSKSDENNILANQAKYVGCEEFIGDSKKVVDCLRNIPAKTLLETQDKFKYYSVEPLTVWGPVIETESTENPEPVLTKLPLEYIEAGEFQKVPWILGTVEQEGIVRVSPMLRQKENREEFNKNFDTFLPKILNFPLSTSDITGLLNNVTNQYLSGKHEIDVSDPKSVEGLINLYSDRFTTYSSYETTLLHSAKGHSPLWYYKFNYKGEYSFESLFAGTTDNINYTWGVAHCDELMYIFKAPGLFGAFKEKNDIAVSEYMVNLWTNFVIYGDPTPTSDDKSSVDWQEQDLKNKEIINENFKYLDISGSIKNSLSVKLQSGFRKERMEFWQNQNIAENSKTVKL